MTPQKASAPLGHCQQPKQQQHPQQAVVMLTRCGRHLQLASTLQTVSQPRYRSCRPCHMTRHAPTTTAITTTAAAAVQGSSQAQPAQSRCAPQLQLCRGSPAPLCCVTNTSQKQQQRQHMLYVSTHRTFSKQQHACAAQVPPSLNTVGQVRGRLPLSLPHYQTNSSSRSRLEAC